MMPFKHPGLEGLKDIQLAPEPAIWPPAPGWYVLAITLLVLTGYCGRMAWKKIRFNRARKAGILAINHIDLSAHNAIVQINRHLKKTVLVYLPNQSLAGMNSLQWSHFICGGLEQYCPDGGDVSAEQLNVLIQSSYRAAPEGKKEALLFRKVALNFLNYALIPMTRLEMSAAQKS